MRQKKLGKRIAMWLLCLAMVLIIINLPAFTTEVEAAAVVATTPLTFTAEEADFIRYIYMGTRF